MSIIHVNESTGGAPNAGRISGTAGDLYSMLKYAVQLNSWTVDFDDAVNFGLILRPATGNRFRLFVLDNATASGAATLTLVRGCESATAATTAGITDPFPTVALVANGSATWLKSSTANTTARAFDIWVGTTWLIYAVNFGGTSNVWEWHFFGDCPPSLSGDSYNTLCTSRNSASAATAVMWSSGTNVFAGTSKAYFCRSYDGTVKSTFAGFQVLAASLGNVGNASQAFLGPTTGLDTDKIPISCAGAQSTTPAAAIGLVTRAWLPNILNPLHLGKQATTPNTRDTFSDTAYNASFVGQVITSGGGAGVSFLAVETSDTWAAPSG